MKNSERVVRRPPGHNTTAEKQAKPPGPKTVTMNPHNRKPPRVERTVNLATAKSMVRLRFEEIQKPRPPSKMNHVAASLSNTPVLQAHRQIAQSEKENVGVEAGHKSEEAAEAGIRTTRNIQRSRKLKPYRQAARTERELDEANLRYIQQKTTQSQPSLSTNPLFPAGNRNRPSGRSIWPSRQGEVPEMRQPLQPIPGLQPKQGVTLQKLLVSCPDMQPMHQKKCSHSF